MTGLATNERTERADALRSALTERAVVADGAIVIHYPEAKYFGV